MVLTYKHGVQISGHIDGSKKYLQRVITYILKYPNGERERTTKSKTTKILSAKKGTKKEAILMLHKFADEYEFPPEQMAIIKADSSETANMLFADYMEEWFEEKRHAIVANTRKSYRRNVYKVIAPYFREKGILLKDLKAKDINDFYNSLRKQGLSETTIRNYHNNMHTALEHAVKLEIIPNSPMIRIDPPKPQKTTMQTYTEEQVNAYIQEVKEHALELPVLFAAMYGLRREEKRLVECDGKVLTLIKIVLPLSIPLYGMMTLNPESGLVLIKQKMIPVTEHCRLVKILKIC